MDYYKITDELYRAIKGFIQSRFPHEGWAGAAGIYTDAGKILVSTAPDYPNDIVSLCHEAGAFCEAYKLNEKISASLCLSRDDSGVYHILTPCGVCQERLFHYGEDVVVGVPSENDSTKWTSKKLKEVQPYYWRRPFL